MVRWFQLGTLLVEKKRQLRHLARMSYPENIRKNKYSKAVII